MRINDQAVRAAGQGTIWDSDLKGFGLRTGKQSKTFIVDIGRGRRKKLGRYPFLTLAQARDAARKILAEKQLGKILPSHTAWDDAKEQYLKQCQVRPSTLAMYKWNLDLFPFKRKSVGDVTPREILQVLNKLSPSNKEHAFRVGRTFFTYCFRQHLIDRNPMERMEPPPNGKARSRVLTDDELKKVYTHACALDTPIKRLVWLLIRTGQRVGETRHLQESWVKETSITFPGSITKNGREHTFPITPETLEGLARFPRTNEYYFPSGRTHVRGRPVQVMTATSNQRADFAKECGVTGWTLHDLRRSFATGLQKLGVKLEVIEAILNHISGSRAGVVGIYQRHDFFQEMQDALERWDAKLRTLST